MQRILAFKNQIRLCILLFLACVLLLPNGARAEIQVIQEPSIQTTGIRKTLVVLVNFINHTEEPVTLTTARTILLPATQSFYKEMSYQKLDISPHVIGWNHLPINTAGYNCSLNLDDRALRQQILDKTIQAVDASVFFPDYKSIVMIYPQLSCPYRGVATKGNKQLVTADGTISAGVVWMNGYHFNDWTIITHELGHNLTLEHAGAFDCEIGVAYSQTRLCYLKEYGDVFDVMGDFQFPSGHFNAAYKKILNWFEPANIWTLRSPADSGDYELDILESASTRPQMIKIDLGNDTAYVLEYRQPVGLDEFLTGQGNLFDGVGIRYIANNLVYGFLGRRSALLDMKPRTNGQSFSNFFDARLPLGETFTDGGRVSITTTRLTNTSATVHIELMDLTPPAAPTGLKAMYQQDDASVQLTWDKVPGASGYEILSGDIFPDYFPFAISQAESFLDTGVFEFGAFVYKVRALDAAGNASPASLPVMVSTVPFSQITPSQSISKALDIIWLRIAVKILGDLIGVSFTFTNDPVLRGVPTKAIHLEELRAYLNFALTKLGISPASFAEPNLKGLPLKAQHIQELQNILHGRSGP